MCRWAESEPGVCFRLGILNDDVMLTTENKIKLSHNSNLGDIIPNSIRKRMFLDDVGQT